MTTDDLGQSDLSGLPVPQDGEQPQDTLVGQPQDGKLELDAYGVPVQDRPAKGRIYLGVTASSVCAAISAWLLIVARISHNYSNYPAWQVWLGAGAGLLATFLAMRTLERAEKGEASTWSGGPCLMAAQDWVH